MRLFRKTFFWLHLVVGLAVGLGVAVLATTGLLMSFEHPIVAWAERADGRPTDGKPPTVERAWTVQRLLQSAAAASPEVTPTALTAYADLTRPVQVQLGRERVVYLNNFTGGVVGQGAPRLRAFFRTDEDVHRWLALNGTGRAWGRNTMGVACLGFTVLIVSGLWLWVPKTFRWRAVKPVLVPSVKLRGKPRDWNWHNVAGIWLMLPLLVITLTGTIIGYSWASGLLFRAVGEAPPAPRGEGPRGGGGGEGQRPGGVANGRRPGGDRGDRRPDGGGVPRPLNVEGLDDAWATAEKAAGKGWTSMTLQLAGGRRGGGGGRDGGEDGGGRGGLSFAVAYGDPAVPTNRVTFTVDRESAELVRTERFTDQTPGRRLRSLIVPIHRGEILGKTGMALAAAACVAALVLVYTGFALSWRRLVRPLLSRRPARRPANALGVSDAVPAPAGT